MTPAVLAMIDVARARASAAGSTRCRATGRVDAGPARAARRDRRGRSASCPSGAPSRRSAPPPPPPSPSVHRRRRRAAGRIAARSRRRRALELIELPELGSGADAERRRSTPSRRSPRRSNGRRRRCRTRRLDAGDALRRSRRCAELGRRTPRRRDAVAALRRDAEPDEIDVGDVTLSASLYRILCDEADQHLATLEHELSTAAVRPAAAPVAGDGAREPHAVRHPSHRRLSAGRRPPRRRWSRRCSRSQQRGAPLPGAAQPVLARAVAGCARSSRASRRARRSRAGDAERGAREIQRELETLRQDDAPQPTSTTPRRAADARSRGARTRRRAATPSRRAPRRADAPRGGRRDAAPTRMRHRRRADASPDRRAEPATEVALPAPPATRCADVRDDVDEQVLPIFLDEAAELFPQAGEQLRAWRRKPGDDASAGAAAAHAAHVQGQRAHGRRDAPGRARAPDGIAPRRGEAPAAATPALFEALDDDLDRHRVRARRAARRRDQRRAAVGRAAHGRGRRRARAVAARPRRLPSVRRRCRPHARVAPAHAGALRRRAAAPDAAPSEAGSRRARACCACAPT